MGKGKTQGIDWLERRGVTNPVILEAMRDVQRDKFVIEDSGNLEHVDVSVTPPEVIAKMIEAMELGERPKVLQVGTGSGYAAAILSRLAQSVYTVEKDIELARIAQKKLADQGFKNVQVLYGPNLKESLANAPYDAILVSAGMIKMPTRLAKRLAIGGVLVAPIGTGKTQKLVRMRRIDEDNFREETLGDLRVQPLLGDILVEMGVVDRENVEMAALEADVKGKRLGEALLEGHYVAEADIYQALATQNGMRLISAQEVLENLRLELLTQYPKAFLSHNRLIPVHSFDGMLHAVTTDPRNEAEELAYAMGLHEIDLHLITPTNYDIVWAAIEQGDVGGGDARDADAEPVDAPAFDAETIAFFERIVRQAIESRASDVHLERFEQEVEAFFRIDGELRLRKEIEIEADRMNGILELVKVSGRLDRKERRRPQTGHFQRRVNDRIYDLQARTVPTAYGESVSIRILPQDAQVLTIDELGFTSDTSAALKRDLQTRSGIILTVGPSSSGRSTTLYAGLQQIAQDRKRKIVAVEHPVTYSLRGVHQYKIDRNVFTVADAVEAAVSGDADVLLFGDISTPELAQQAVRASRAGHLVLASISGRVAVDGLLRLLEFGISPHAVSSEVVSVLAQRLVKRVCTECRERTEVDDDIVETVFAGEQPDGLIAFAGFGCSHCEQHGTRGRIPVAEYLPVDTSVKAAIAGHPTAEALHAASVNAGTTAMLDTGIRFVKSGIIAQDELRWIPRWT